MARDSRRKRWGRPENAVDYLLLLVPVAILLGLLHAPPTLVFLCSATAIVPLAGIMGRATERLAGTAGPGIGGLLDATFGNAAELIIAVIGLSRGLGDVVKASITGSIIGNSLLVLGLSILAGGLKYPVQRFNRTAASVGSTLMALAAIGMIVPTLFWHAAQGARAAPAAEGALAAPLGDPLALGRLERGLSLEIAVVLGLVYLLSLVFSLRTHRHLYAGDESPVADVHGDAAGNAVQVSGSATHGCGNAAQRSGSAVRDASHGCGNAAHSSANDPRGFLNAARGSGTAARGSGSGAPEAAPGGTASIGRPILALLASSALVAVLAELLVGALEPTAHA